MAAVLQERPLVARLVAPFFAWYLPRLEERSGALSRPHERIADRPAAEATSPAALGRARIRTAAAEDVD